MRDVWKTGSDSVLKNWTVQKFDTHSDSVFADINCMQFTIQIKSK